MALFSIEEGIAKVLIDCAKVWVKYRGLKWLGWIG
jgi:hypothetical protein